MTTFILLSITAAVFYYLGRKDESQSYNRQKKHYESIIAELKSEIIVQKEINK